MPILAVLAWRTFYLEKHRYLLMEFSWPLSHIGLAQHFALPASQNTPPVSPRSSLVTTPNYIRPLT